MNDPIAVLLVLGFIEWELHPGYGVPDMLLLFVQQLGIGLVAGVAVGRLSRWAFQQMQFSSPGLYPVASLAAAALSFGVGRRAARLGLPRRLPHRARARHRQPARQADRDGVPRGPRMGRAARRCSSRSACSCSRRSSARSPGRARCSRCSWSSSSRPLATVISLVGARFSFARTGAPRLGRAARRGPRRAGHVPDPRRRPALGRVLQHRLLRGPALDRPPGHDDRARRALAGGDVRRAGPDALGGRGRHDPRARRRRRRARDPRRGTPRRARGCATSGCRATRSSR